MLAMTSNKSAGLRILLVEGEIERLIKWGVRVRKHAWAMCERKTSPKREGYVLGESSMVWGRGWEKRSRICN